MELTWKSYGDTGRVADGNHGKWRVVEGVRAWHLSVEPKFTRGMLPRGEFQDRAVAMAFAQDRENEIEGENMTAAETVSTAPEVDITPFNDTSGWLIVHPDMVEMIKDAAKKADRAPFSVWLDDSLWGDDDTYNDEYELSSTIPAVWWAEIDYLWDVWSHPEDYRALYLMASNLSTITGKTLYTVLESKPAKDLLIDPDDDRYGRLRELCATGGGEPSVETCYTDKRVQALSIARGVLGRYGFDWLSAELECLGTTDHLVALALRPYIGQIEGWDQSAYDALRRSFEYHHGELLHPDDRPLDDVTYKERSALPSGQPRN